jgi:uncharacterized membrane protein
LVGKAAGLGVVTTLTLARGVSGVLSVLVCALAISIAGGAAPFLFVVLSLPMSLFQMASASQDGPLFALVALAVAIFAGMRDRQAASMPLFTVMSLSVALVAIARPPYVVLAVLPLLAFGRPLTSRLVAVAAIIASVAVWVMLVAPLGSVAVSPGTDPPAQIAMMRAHPLTTLWIFGRSLTASLLDSFIGRLGWLDTRLPIPFHVLAVAALLFGGAASAASLHHGARAGASALIVAAIIAAMLMFFATLFVIWTVPGMTTVAGVQGRYLIPLALLAAAAIPSTRWTETAPFVVRVAPVLLGMFAPLSIVVMVVALVRRYYVA